MRTGQGQMRYDDGDEAPLQQAAYRAVRFWRNDLRASLLFLTRVPLKAARAEGDARPSRPRRARLPHRRRADRAGRRHYVYGIAVGIGLPDIVAAVLAVGAGALVTGALHEDGLADMADGFGGGKSPERKLAIMRDSRIGAYGVIVLVVVLAAKVGAISDLGSTGFVIAAMVAAAAASRAAMPAVMLWLEPARSDGLAADAGRPPSTHVWTGLALAAVLAVGLLTWSGLVAFIVAGLGTAAVARLAERQVGGHTGDVLGGVQQFSEVLFLLTLAAVR